LWIFEYWLDSIFRREYVLSKSLSIFQKCFTVNKDLPCFCYHEYLSVAGNCRMCLVEVTNSLKLLAGCAVMLTGHLIILTNTERVKKARQSILEMLLSAHPLDCPICDQAGECDLQDINIVFGSDKSRFYELKKRAVLNKDCGIFIKTIMTRCIHCTRCVRFLKEIVGEKKLGMLGRGAGSEISTYIKNSLTHGLSGNIVDICPVGALTINPYKYTVRRWEIQDNSNSVAIIDFFDALGSNIQIDVLNNKIYRIVSRYNRDINEDWITDKIKYCYDANDLQRLTYPCLLKNRQYKIISWESACNIFWYNFVKYCIKGYITILLGNFIDIKLTMYTKQFFNKLGIEIYIGENMDVLMDNEYDFFFNISLVSMENETNFFFLWFNSRLEMPLLHIRLKRNAFNKYYYSFGNWIGYTDIDISFINFGNKLSDLFTFISGKTINNSLLNNNLFRFQSFLLKIKKRLCCFFGIKLKYMFDKMYLKEYLYTFFSAKSTINNIFPYMSYLSMLEIGIKMHNQINLKNSFIFLLGVDDIDILYKLTDKSNFRVYLGSHNDIGANSSHLLLPIPTLFETNSKFFNVLGTLSKLNKAVSTDNWMIETIYSMLLNKMEDYLECLKFRFVFKLWKYFIFLNKNYLFKFNEQIEFKLYFNTMSVKMFFMDYFVGYYKHNYYKTDSYSRASKLLNLMSIEFAKKHLNMC